MSNTILNGPEVKGTVVGDSVGAAFVDVANATGVGRYVAVAVGEIVEPGISLDMQPARRTAVNKKQNIL